MMGIETIFCLFVMSRKGFNLLKKATKILHSSSKMSRDDPIRNAQEATESASGILHNLGATSAPKLDNTSQY